ncbi:unnamed protein product [Cylicocyclus nassatus]|uniref:Uncharacterized protein n=1 Tax=Cylicocyclus nassatus TaxID=53992 RepID=A0AA36DPQ1_CYLNA|nr:unnamed protein product [Cylicocyclus nassatus]
MLPVIVWLFLISLTRCEDPPSSQLQPPRVRNRRAVDLCKLPMDSGSCSRELIRYYYDAADDDCKRFTYSGCGGNANRFMRRVNCRNRCVKNKDSLGKSIEPPKKLSVVERSSNDTKVFQTHPTTTTSTTKLWTTAATALTSKTARTASVKRIEITKASPNIRSCPDCDPFYGICEEDGKCGCIPGFRKLGKICIDVNECNRPNACPPNAHCVNTLGSFRCDCPAGFGPDGDCAVKKGKN